MIYSFARVGAALAMKREDVFVQGRRLWLRLHEKDGKRHEMPCHHILEDYLLAYIEACGIDEGRGPLFRTIARGTKTLSATPLRQAKAHAMVRRRARAGSGHRSQSQFPRDRHHYLSQEWQEPRKRRRHGHHSSTRTTQLYDRRRDEISLAEVERVRI